MPANLLEKNDNEQAERIFEKYNRAHNEKEQNNLLEQDYSNQELIKDLEFFANSTNLNAILVDVNGQEISRSFNFASFRKLIHSVERMSQDTKERLSDDFTEKIANESPDEASKDVQNHSFLPYSIHRSHAGHIDISLPLFVNKKLLGFLVCGQVDKSELKEIAKDDFNSENHESENSSDLKQYYLRLNSCTKHDSLAQESEHLRQSPPSELFRSTNHLSIVNRSQSSNIESQGIDTKVDYDYSSDENKEISQHPVHIHHKEIDKAIDYISQNFCLPLTLDQVAAHVFYSPSFFSRTFKKEVGESFISFLTKLRIKEAKKLLVTTNMPIKTISRNLGYKQSSYFCKIFKKLVGTTPGLYRAKNQD